MIEKLIKTDVAEFNKRTLKELKPYFDLDILICDPAERYQWFRNLRTLAQHSLGIAHCIHHNHYPRLHIANKFRNKQYPDFYDPAYENMIGCWSGWKSADQIRLDGTIITGTKHWISMVDQADFGLFKIPVNDTEAVVLINFADAKPAIDMTYASPLGMEIARPGSVNIEKYNLPDYSILGYKNYYEINPEFSHISNFSDYCFTTNYLGLILSLYEELRCYIEERKITGIDFVFKKLGLEISGLVMIWEDNLPSVDIAVPDDVFWHRRNTQYTMGKNVLINLIGLVLQVGDPLWLSSSSPRSQKLRDALTFCSHMRTLNKNLQDKHFISLNTAT